MKKETETRSALAKDLAEHTLFYDALRRVLDALAHYLVAHFLDGQPVPRSVVALALLPDRRHDLEALLPEIAEDLADAAPHRVSPGQRALAAQTATFLRNADAVLHASVHRAAKTDRLRVLRAEIDAATPDVRGRVAVRRPRTASGDGAFVETDDDGPLEVWEVLRENSQYWYLKPCVLARNEPPPEGEKDNCVKVPKRAKDARPLWRVYVPSAPPAETA